MNLPLPERYRPHKFDDVIGQKGVLKAINVALTRKIPPKSWLLSGPSGTGKTTLAEILANHFAGGRATDANVVYVNAAVDTGAEETRNTVNRAFYKALAPSPVKTHVVDECQNLSQKAWDSLLVATEKPPAHVYWIFCSTNPSKIPDTIKTRCVSYVLKPVEVDEIFERLITVVEKEKLDTPLEVLEVIASECNGSPRQALTSLEKCAHAKTPGEVRELLRLAINEKGPVDIAKALMGKQKMTWSQIVKLVDALGNSEAENTRIVISNYIAGALMRTNSDAEARRMLFLLECFSTPYIASDKRAPLLMSIGLALGMDQ